MGSCEDEKANSVLDDTSPSARPQGWFASTTDFLTRWGVETNGFVAMFCLTPAPDLTYLLLRIDPISPDDRTDTKLYQMFFVWFSANLNILACVIPHQSMRTLVRYV